MSVRTYENREGKRRNADVKTRIEALHQSLDAGREWLSAETRAHGEKQLSIARGRLRQSLDHTVIAISGPTGAGKSSLINALAGKTLAKVSVRRPTTSQALGVVWDSTQEGRTQAGQLLDWLGVQERHYLSQLDVKTDKVKNKEQLDAGLIVVDLPDFDSVEKEHRVRADHLTERADLLVWVTDPQKYADAIFHHEYLRKFNQNTEMLVVLNQVDRLSLQAKEQCLADIRRLLVKDGISGAKVLAASTKTGEGISELQSLLQIAAARRAAHGNRLIADLREVGKAIAEECGQVPSRTVSEGPKEELVESLAQAAGVYQITDAVYASSLRRSHIATGWPVTSWIAKARRDPLRTLGLTQKWVPGKKKSPVVDAPASEVNPSLARSSVVVQDSAMLAKANLAVRNYIDQATQGGPTDWILGVRQKLRDVDLGDDLDSAITNSPSIQLPQPGWWKVIGLLHKLFLVAFVAGLLWLGFLAGAAYLRLDVPNTPTWEGFPIPTILTVGGLALGIILGLICRVLSIVHARRQARRVFGALRAEVNEVAERKVILPVRAERDQRETCMLAALVAAR